MVEGHFILLYFLEDLCIYLREREGGREGEHVCPQSPASCGGAEGEGKRLPSRLLLSSEAKAGSTSGP